MNGLERRSDLESLLGDFETEMSPRKLFDAPPLSEWESEIKGVMGELIHELWLTRYPVRDWISNARLAAQVVEKSYAQLVLTRPVDADGRVVPEFSMRLNNFQEACRVLAKAIEKFPNRILVT